MFYRRRERDPAFAEKWREAEEAGIDVLEDEMRRRALEGDERPIFYQGAQVGSYRQKSDALLMFALKSKRPDKFRDVGGGGVEVIGAAADAPLSIRWVTSYRLGSE